MAQLSDERLIGVMRTYGDVVGADALGELMKYTERHARRFVDHPPKSLPNKKRKLAIRHVTRMLEEIQEVSEQEARAAEALGEAPTSSTEPGEGVPEKFRRFRTSEEDHGDGTGGRERA